MPACISYAVRFCIPLARMNNAEIVTSGYRLILQREPDAEGARMWIDMLARGLTQPAFIDALIASPEYQHNIKRPISREVDIGGLRFTIASHAHDAYVGGEIQTKNNYEPWVTPHFIAVLKADSIVVDIGANIGWYAMLAAARTRGAGRVHAFEPLPENVQLLLHNALVNGFSHLTCLPIALADRAAVVRIVAVAGSNASLDTREDAGGFLCQALAAHDVLASIGRFDVLKMDIEGYEPAVLRSAAALLRRIRPTMFIEYHPWIVANHGFSVDEFNDLIFGLGMHVDVLMRDLSTRRVNHAAALVALHKHLDLDWGGEGKFHLDLRLTP